MGVEDRLQTPGSGLAFDVGERTFPSIWNDRANLLFSHLTMAL
jgi:hypothetical protein